MTPFIRSLRERAAATRPRIAFPEAADPRTNEAIRTLKAQGIVEPVLVDPERDQRRQDVAATLLELRASKGMTEADADRYSRDPLYFADWLVRTGDVAGCVAGAVYTTADVLRAGLWLVGPAPNVRTISSAFYMVGTRFPRTGCRGPDLHGLCSRSAAECVPARGYRDRRRCRSAADSR